MLKVLSVLLLTVAAALAQNADEWEPFRRTGLFAAKSALWIAPDMEKESVSEFSARLLDGTRHDDAKAMATLGRFFFVRGDTVRAGEWLAKAAEAGHGGAQLDLGVLCAQGNGRPQDFVEGYKWIWLATWGKVPGADAVLVEISQKLNGGQVLDGVQRASRFLDAHKKDAKTPSAVGR
jgi:TPR repeat protein